MYIPTFCQVACISFYGSVLLVLYTHCLYYFQCPGMVVVQVGSGQEKGSEFYIYHILCSHSVHDPPAFSKRLVYKNNNFLTRVFQ